MPAADRGEEKDPRLATEARFIRKVVSRQAVQHPHHDSPWKNLLYLLILVPVLSAVVLLLAAAELRRSVLDTLVTRVGEGYLDDSARVFRMPPPAAHAPREITVYAPGSAAGGSDTKAPPSEGAEPTRQDQVARAEDRDSSVFTPPPKSAGSEEALQRLLDSSQVAGRLKENQLPGYQFQEWKPVRDESPLFWIEFSVLRQSDNASLAVTWEVDLESGHVRPLSQAARDLEREAKDGGGT